MKNLFQATFHGIIILVSILLLSPNASAQITVDAGPNTTFCGSGTMTIGGSPTHVGGTPPITYTWSPSTGLSSTSIANPVATVSTTTTYTVTTSDFNGRGGTDSITLTVANPPVVTFDTIPDVCENDPIVTLTQGSPSGGTYAGAGITTSPMFDPSIVGPGVYNLSYSYTDPACSTSFMVTQNVVVILAPSLAIVLNPDTICAGDTAEITVSGADSYLWQMDSSLSAIDTSIVDAFPDSSTTYWITGSSINGCSSRDSIVLEVKDCTTIGISENSLNYITVFPNPSNGLFNLIGNQKAMSLQLMDISGKVIYSQERNVGNQQIDLRHLNSGLYYLSIQTSKGNYFEKLVINQ